MRSDVPMSGSRDPRTPDRLRPFANARGIFSLLMFSLPLRRSDFLAACPRKELLLAVFHFRRFAIKQFAAHSQVCAK